jgi:hypothetical protein
LATKPKSTEPTPSELEVPEQDSKRSLVRNPLTTLSGLIAEAARVYRAMRDNKIDEVDDARSRHRMCHRVIVGSESLEGGRPHAGYHDRL